MPQDFSGKNLRGRSFKGQDLTGANFSRADIRGTNFTGANLEGANFRNTQAGLQQHWKFLLLLASCILATLSGMIFGVASSWPTAFLSLVITKEIASFLGISILILFAVFFIITIRYGLQNGLIAGSGLAAIALTTFGLMVGVLAGVLFATVAEAIAIAVAASVVRFGVGILVGCLAVTIGGLTAWYFSVYVNPVMLGFTIDVGLVTVSLAGSIAMTLVSGYIGLRVLARDEKFSLVQTMATAIASMGGTSFRCAVLTDADFQQAILGNTDFRRAFLMRTHWFQAKKLEYARLGESYLLNSKVQQLVITNNGQNQNFDRLDLCGINLHGANLKDASFVSTDLNKANLQDVDLSRSKLVQTQLDATDLTGATLTGATIEDWGITSHTKLYGVRCEYVFMRLPTKEDPNPHRKPDDWKEEFAPGDFGDFIKPIVDTLDLYHNQGVDPRAIAIAFKKLAENNPNAELEIVAMEKRGQDKFLLRAKTAFMTDKSQLNAEYFNTYNWLKALPEVEVNLLLAEKDSRIRSLETMVVTALKRPSFYAQTYNNQGDTMSQNPQKQSTFNLQGAQFGGGLVDAETVHANQIGGNITNYTTEQKQNLAQAAAEIQQLLIQLEQTNPTTTSVQKMAVVAQAVDEIEKNPTLKACVVGALKSEGAEALKEAVNHPLANVLIAAVEG